MYENADTNLLKEKKKILPKAILFHEKVLESGTRTKTFVFRRGGGVLDEDSSISQQIREPCKCQLPLIHGGMGLTLRARTSRAYDYDRSSLCKA